MLRGKLEFASGEEDRETETLTHLLRRATADTARARLRGLDLTPLAEAVSRSPVRTGERVAAAALAAGQVALGVGMRSAREMACEIGVPGAAVGEADLHALSLTHRMKCSYTA